MRGFTCSSIGEYLERLRVASAVAVDVEDLSAPRLVSAPENDSKWPSIAEIASVDDLTYDEFRRRATDTWETLFHFAYALTYARLKESLPSAERIALLGKLNAGFPLAYGPIDLARFNDYIEESLLQLRPRQVRYAILAIEIYVELLWLLRGTGVARGACVPVCAGRNTNDKEFNLVEFVTMHFHRCAVKRDGERMGHVVINDASNEFHGWRFDKLQGFSAENPALLSLYVSSDPVRPRQPQPEWKYIWFPNYIEFFDQSKAQLVSTYAWMDEDEDPSAGRWVYLSTNGQKLAIDATSAPPDQTWEQNAALYETVHRLSEDVQSQSARTQLRHAFKITLAICIPFGQVVADRERHAFALYVNLIFYSGASGLTGTSDDALVKATELLHQRLDSLRFLALQTLASELVLLAEDQSRQLEARQATYLSVMPEVRDINRIISSLQKKIQYVNSQIAPPSEGLMSAYSEVAPLFEQGYRVRIPHRDEILVPHNAIDFKNPSDRPREADCAWVLGLAIDRMLGRTTGSSDAGRDLRQRHVKDWSPERSETGHIPANGPLDIHLANEYLASVLYRLRISKDMEIARSIDELTRFENQTGVHRSLLEDILPEFSEQIEFLSSFKKRYHEVLKFGSDGAKLSLSQLRPYLPISGSSSAQGHLWRRTGLPSHAPLIQFLSYFIGLHRSKASTSQVSFGVEKHQASDENTATFELLGVGTAHLLVDRKKYDAKRIARLLSTLWTQFEQNGVPVNQTGYSYGDIVSPFVRFIESIHRHCDLKVDVDGDRLILQVTDPRSGQNHGSPDCLKIGVDPNSRRISVSSRTNARESRQ